MTFVLQIIGLILAFYFIVFGIVFLLPYVHYIFVLVVLAILARRLDK